MKKIEIITLPVAPLDCNCSILFCDKTGETAVIDPGGDVDHILKILKMRNARLRWVILTHAHFDHCMGVDDLVESLRGQGNPYPELALHQKDLALYRILQRQTHYFGLPVPEPRTPVDRALEDGDRILFGEVSLLVFHTPGHTKGSCSLYLEEERVLFSGDTIFAQGIGRTDLPGGDYGELLNSIKTKIFTLDEETRIIPGHGPETNVLDEKRGNPFLAGINQ